MLRAASSRAVTRRRFAPASPSAPGGAASASASALASADGAINDTHVAPDSSAEASSVAPSCVEAAWQMLCTSQSWLASVLQRTALHLVGSGLSCIWDGARRGE